MGSLRLARPELLFSGGATPRRLKSAFCPNSQHDRRKTRGFQINSITVKNITSADSKFSHVFGFQKNLCFGKHSCAFTLQFVKPILK